MAGIKIYYWNATCLATWRVYWEDVEVVSNSGGMREVGGAVWLTKGRWEGVRFARRFQFQVVSTEAKPSAGGQQQSTEENAAHLAQLLVEMSQSAGGRIMVLACGEEPSGGIPSGWSHTEAPPPVSVIRPRRWVTWRAAHQRSTQLGISVTGRVFPD